MQHNFQQNNFNKHEKVKQNGKMGGHEINVDFLTLFLTYCGNFMWLCGKNI